MNQLGGIDLLILLLAFLSTYAGIRAGLIRSCFNIAGITAGLITATRYYSYGGSFLAEQTGLPAGWADLLSLLFIFLIVSALVSLIGSLAAGLTRFRLIRVVDRIGGAAVGLGIGLVIAGALLVVLTAFPFGDSLKEHLDDSLLAPHITEPSSALLEKIETVIPFQLPKLAFYPEELTGFRQEEPSSTDFKVIDFSTLDGATCFVCQNKVVFLGYHTNKYGSTSPKFVCTGCGRTSDGCQTYEGHHLLYNRCPVVLGKQGYRFDCGIWSNGNYQRPTGKCPVCGASSFAKDAGEHRIYSSVFLLDPDRGHLYQEP
jgi:uncharacterized membrane protein required for colicin V production